MEFSFSRLLYFFFFFFSLSLLFDTTQSATLVVDGVSEWKDTTVQVGDTIIFEHKYHYNLFIFQNRRAFNLCNFTQATLLKNPNSTSYTWHPSRLGFFYFSFNNGSTKPCQEGQKLAIKISFSQPEISPPQPPMSAPPISSGGVVSSSPSYPWPFRPRESTSPSPAPSAILPAMSPSIVPNNKGGGGAIPFINSNPAVPLPTGEVDSATIGPLPISGGHHRLQVLEFHKVQTAFCCVLVLVLVPL